MRASVSARTERLPAVCSRIACATCCSRSAGLCSPTGRSTSVDSTRPSSTGASAPDTHNGTIARIRRVEVTGSPRASSQARSAPVTTVRTTSFTVHPCAVRISRYAARSPRATANRRWVESATLSGDPGASLPPVTTVPTSAPHPAGEPGRHGERVVGGGPDDVDHLAGPGDRLGHRVHDEAGVRRLGPRHPQLVGHLAGRGRRVQQHLAHVDRRDAVDHRLVGLRDDREAAVGEPLDEVDLPQRAVRVERPRHQPGHQLGELGGRPGPGQRRAADVERDVEVGVVDPDRPGQLARDVAHLLPVPRHRHQPPLDGRDQALVVEPARRCAEDPHRPDVHGRARLLQVEERRVDGREPGWRHAAIVGIGRRGTLDDRGPLSQGHLHHRVRPQARAGGPGRRRPARRQGRAGRRRARRADPGHPRGGAGPRGARPARVGAPGEGAGRQRAARPGCARRRGRAPDAARRRVPRSTSATIPQRCSCSTA